MLTGYKTYLAAGAAAMIAVGVAIQAYCEGLPIDYSLVIEALIAFAMIFLRKGIKTETTKTEIVK